MIDGFWEMSKLMKDDRVLCVKIVTIGGLGTPIVHFKSLSLYNS
jgi:hypothetical protein